MSSPFCLPSTINLSEQKFSRVIPSDRCRAAHKRSLSDNGMGTTKAPMEKQRHTLPVPSPPLLRILRHHQPSSSSATSSHLMIPSPSSIGCISSSSSSSSSLNKSRFFPSTRFFIALLLCFCYVSIGISTSNISSAIICMVRNDSQKMLSLENDHNTKNDRIIRRGNGEPTQKNTNNSSPFSSEFVADLSSLVKPVPSSECDHRRTRRDSQIYRQTCHEAEKLAWTSTQQGVVFAGQNAGSLLMLFTGRHADRLNSKWTIVAALLLLVISNASLPFVAPIHFLLAVLARVLTGVSDALLQPSTSSLITRWFPPKERPFAIGLITGGRQIGTILINPLSGWICDQSVHNPDGPFLWHTVFFVSSVVGLSILFAWLLLSADKPSKHFCTSIQERFFVEEKIAEEKLGKRTEKRPIPWAHLARCKPFYAGVAALICHEYPLVIMLQLLSKYINDVYDDVTFTTNGLLSALPIAILFISKTLSASLASFIQSRKKGRFLIGRTTMVKLFNGIASLGLGVCVILVPMMNRAEHNHMALCFICLANAFAGLHTPGVQTALLQIAPAFTGIITGIAFGCVAVASICNKLISSTIITDRSINNWAIVFWISGVIALLPVVFFTIWGSADRQPWASIGRKRPSKRRNSAKRSDAKVYPTEGKTRPNGGPSKSKTDEHETIRTAKSENETAVRVDKVGKDEEEEDGESAHFEAEAAVAAALRLQMYLEDTDEEQEEQTTETEETAQNNTEHSKECQGQFDDRSVIGRANGE
ncbi:hypothetical protein niasHS_017595 [Heterodera schachtii]|uniref:Major facilitator superfamily (MFS) profile domain-containing protein n=2 Tax=Heterodera TaxID=34509 RepID=A0ABD2I046_HETSC